MRFDVVHSNARGTFYVFILIENFAFTTFPFCQVIVKGP